MGWKLGVFGGSTGNDKDKPATNALVFATQDEAARAGDELLSRWFGPTGSTTFEVTEEATHEFPAGITRPRAIAKEIA